MTKEERNKIWQELRREASGRVSHLKNKIRTELDSPFWQEVKQRPKQALFWAESLSPEIARRLLSYASVASLPGNQGYGFELTDWTDQGVAATLSPKDANRPNVEATLADVIGGAEKILRLYWERHLLAPSDRLEIQSVRLQRLGAWKGRLQLRYGLTHPAREKLRILGASEGGLCQEIAIPLFNEQNIQVGDVSFELKWESTPALA
ncbi:MAG: hypothetical protein H6624_18185 [Bdellovibrionaceae bacterium]|nr:hypothetical protein [Bdellovibrionales bacterium]MCB9086273.1 hypothetical protein [Pseudobdellovibrionaceae bacterium]